ncbi:MAG: Hint domain-containing protein [Acidiphilium sp.]
MSGSTLVTIGLLGTTEIDTTGTYTLDVTGAGTADIHGAGTAATPVTVTVGSLLGAGILFTTDISDNATEIVNGALGVSAIDTFNIGKDAAGSILGEGTLELGSALGVTLAQAINFFGTDNKLVLDKGLNISLLDNLNNFAPSDTIELKGVTATSATFTQNNLLSIPTAGGNVTLYNGTTAVDTFTLANGTYASNAFQVATDPAGGVDLTVCFLEGTRLLGLHRDIAVEDMEPGDRLITDSGAMRPVRWVGKRSIDTDRHPN